MIRQEKIIALVFAALALAGTAASPQTFARPSAKPPHHVKPFLRAFQLNVINGPVTLRPMHGKSIALLQSKTVRVHTGDRLHLGEGSVVLLSLGGEILTWEGPDERVISLDANRKLTSAGHKRNGPPFIHPVSGAVVDLNDFTIDWTPGYTTNEVLSLYAVGTAKPIWTQTGVESHWGTVDAAAVRAAIKRQMAGRKGQVFVLVLSDGYQDTLASWFTVR